MLILKKWLSILSFCLVSLSLSNAHGDTDNHTQSPALTEESIFNSTYTKWSHSVDGLAALMIEMKHHISIDVLKTNNKDESITWCRATIEKLHEWRKSIKKTLSLNTIHKALIPICALTSSLLQSLEPEIVDLNSVKFSDRVDHNNALGSDASTLQTQIDNSLEKLRTRIDEKTGQLTTINKIARFIEEVLLETDEKTGLSTWGPYAPGILGATVRYLPEAARNWITKHLYGGVLPHWDIQYLGYMPQFRIVGQMGPNGIALPEPQYHRLGRIEKMYSQLIALYVAYRIWSMYPGFEKLIASFESFADIAKDKTASVWSYLKGKRHFPKNYKFEIIEEIDFSDENLIGLEEQKKQVSDVINFMVDHENFIRSGHTVSKGISLTGPAGTGKTLFARALAGTINKRLREMGQDDMVNFIEPTMENLVGHIYKGDQLLGSQNGINSDHKNKFTEFVNELKAHAPVIAFIDKGHMLRLQTSGDTELFNRVSSVLNELNANPEEKIIIIVATSRPDLIAKELLTYQRLSKQIRLPLPNAELRKQFFVLKLVKQLLLDPENLDIDSYVNQTVGCNYAQLDAVVMAAKFSAKHQLSNDTSSVLGHTHIQQAIDHEIHRLIPSSSLTYAEQEIVALHMAAHILIHHLVRPTQIIERATILGYHKPIIEVYEHPTYKNGYNHEEQFAIKYGKIITYNPYETLNISSASNNEKLAQIALAGHIAEKLIYNSPMSNYHENDEKDAWNYLYKSWGAKATACAEESNLSDVCNNAKSEIHQRLKVLETKTEELLQAHKDTLLMLAKRLQEQSILTGKEIAQLLTKSE